MNPEEAVSLLLVENEEFEVRRIKNTLELRHGKFRITDIVPDARTALETIAPQSTRYDVVVLDGQAMGGLREEEFVARANCIDPSLQIVVLRAQGAVPEEGSCDDALTNAGVFWYCAKYPRTCERYIYQATDFVLSLLNASDRRRLERRKKEGEEFLQRNVERLLEEQKLIGASEAMSRLRLEIAQHAKSDDNLLIMGESGSGKELAARNIHLMSNRRCEEFVRVSCSAGSLEYMKSGQCDEMAWSGGNNDGCTIFLKDVAGLLPDVQAGLLRRIESGGARIIASTQSDLAEASNTGRFMRELYRLLSPATLFIPPLRKRAGDVLLLFDYFLHLLCRELDLPLPGIAPEVSQILLSYDWPGNVHELRSLTHRLLLGSGISITGDSVRELLLEKREERPKVVLPFGGIGDGEVIPLREMEQRFRSWYFGYVKGVSTSDANAARKLGLAPPNFYRMCKKLGMK